MQEVGGSIPPGSTTLRTDNATKGVRPSPVRLPHPASVQRRRHIVCAPCCRANIARARLRRWGMRRVTMRAALVAAIGAATSVLITSLASAGPAAAQQQMAQTQSADPNEPDQAAPPPAAKPHRKSSKLTTPTNPDLDTDDQLAPSQMQQQMPAAVARPSSAPVQPTRPAASAASG